MQHEMYNTPLAPPERIEDALAKQTREDFLAHVGRVLEDRQTEYGSPWKQLDSISRRWSITLGVPVTAQQVALCMIDLKMVRIAQNPERADSPVDVAGYATLLAQLAARKGTHE
mgnify:CR=1 FL=1